MYRMDTIVYIQNAGDEQQMIKKFWKHNNDKSSSIFNIKIVEIIEEA